MATSDFQLARISESSGHTVLLPSAQEQEHRDDSLSIHSMSSSTDFASAISVTPSPASPILGAGSLELALSPAEELENPRAPSPQPERDEGSPQATLEHVEVADTRSGREEVMDSARRSSATERETSPYRMERVPASNASLMSSDTKRDGAGREEEHRAHGKRGSDATTVQMFAEESYPPSHKGASWGASKVNAQEFEYPEGGWRAWGNVVGAWVSPTEGRNRAPSRQLMSSNAAHAVRYFWM